MKKFLLTVFAALVCSTSIFAQTLDERKLEIKERNAIAKLDRKQVDGKISKTAKAEAKKLKKEGWTNAPGSLPLEAQLNDLFIKKYQMDGIFPKFIIGNIKAVGSTSAAARKQAMALAQVEICEQIEAEVAELIENTISNNMISEEEGQSLNKMTAASKTLVQQKLGRTLIVMEAYRTNKEGKTECNIAVSYDGTQAKSAIIEAMEKEGKEAQDKLTKILEGK